MESFKLTIDNLGSSGEGVGRWEGIPIFVEGALPGEEVEVDLFLRKKNYGKASLKKILSPSPDREKPPCPYFAKCGGCQLQHLAYDKQLQRKQQRVEEALKRIGAFADLIVHPCRPSPATLHYRNKMQVPVKGTPGSFQVGLYAKGSNDLIEVDRCLIHSEKGDHVYNTAAALLRQSELAEGEVRHLLVRSSSQGVLVVWVIKEKVVSSQLLEISKTLIEQCPDVKGIVLNINSRDDNVILGKEWITLLGNDHIWETLHGLTFKISPASFFQVNPQQAEQLYAEAIRMIDPTATIVDAYCGVGTLSCMLAKKARRVVGIECIPQAIEDAKENAKRNTLDNIEFICGNTEDKIHTLEDVDVIVLNPPRKGCDPSVITNILKRKVEQVIYISCDPATLARDLKLFEGYTVTHVQPFDMFPQTAHVETVVQLQRKEL